MTTIVVASTSFLGFYSVRFLAVSSAVVDRLKEVSASSEQSPCKLPGICSH